MSVLRKEDQTITDYKDCICNFQETMHTHMPSFPSIKPEARPKNRHYWWYLRHWIEITQAIPIALFDFKYSFEHAVVKNTKNPGFFLLNQVVLFLIVALRMSPPSFPSNIPTRTLDSEGQLY